MRTCPRGRAGFYFCIRLGLAPQTAPRDSSWSSVTVAKIVPRRFCLANRDGTHCATLIVNSVPHRRRFAHNQLAVGTLVLIGLDVPLCGTAVSVLCCRHRGNGTESRCYLSRWVVSDFSKSFRCERSLSFWSRSASVTHSLIRIFTHLRSPTHWLTNSLIDSVWSRRW